MPRATAAIRPISGGWWRVCANWAETLLDDALHSPIITAFYSPKADTYRFAEFYQRLKQQGFVIYPGKVSQSDCFRIGNIGEIYPQDIERLLAAVGQAMYWNQ